MGANLRPAATPGGERRRRRRRGKFNWEMVSRSGELAGVGLEFLVVDGDGRVRRDYPFIES
jgi:hypothetical protein